MSLKQLNHSRQRSGAILFVVVACLALFLSVGIAFVFYANQQAIAERLQREASFGGRVAYVEGGQGTRGATDEAPPLATDLFNFGLGQLIYDVPDPASGSFVYSAMYGHSLARAMYGWNSTLPASNVVPYNGLGRVHTSGTDQYPLINYAYQGTGAQRRPEWESGIYIAKNAPYTYPDENNCYLAAVRSSDGRVLVPSFHRPWLTGTNWSPSLSLLRANLPQPPIANSIFNPSDTSYGDVENFEGKMTHQYDSIWMDLDAPVRSWRGRYYKPLFAFLVVDLDGRININVAGNNKGPGHTSYQGHGPWEMNPNYVLDPSNNLVTGQGTQALIGGGGTLNRYGSNFNPTSIYSLTGVASQSAPVGAAVPYYSILDFDASSTTNPDLRGKLSLIYPQQQPYYTVPYFPGRDNINGGNGASYNEQLNHPLLYNPYFAIRTKAPKPSWPYELCFGPEEMFYLNSKINSDPTNYAKSDLATLATGLQNPSLTSLNYRLMITTISNDLQLPGMRPWRTSAGTNFVTNAPPNVLPTGTPQTSPTPGSAVPGPSEFDANWRSILAATLGSIDLNRKLTDYRTNPSLPFESPGNVTAASYTQAVTDRQALAMDIFTRLAAATGAKLPSEPMPAPISASVGSSGPKYDALRRLAQIAVNIVDYIDNDDYITPFNWNPAYPNMDPTSLQNGWVFGTELPRLVINEVYSNLDNNYNQNQDPMTQPVTNKQYAGSTNGYKCGVWVELANPLTPPNGTDPNLSHLGGAPLIYPAPGTGNNAQPYPVYQLVITKSVNATLAYPTNVDGSPDPTTVAAANNSAGPIITVSPLADPTNVTIWGGVVPPSSAKQGSVPAPGQQGANPAFYVVGPQNVMNTQNSQNQPATVPGGNNIPVSFQAPMGSDGNSLMMWNVLPLTTNLPLPVGTGPSTILLRRLLCPHQQPNPVVNGNLQYANLPYNPYITVDYVVMNQNQVYDHRAFVPLPQGTNPSQVPFSAQYSWGRNQPYAGAPGFYAQQGNPTQGAATQMGVQNDNTPINSTFYQQNASTVVQNYNPPYFDWLVHLDRPLISPPELFCVSAYPAYQLTQQFVTGTLAAPIKQQHLEAWYVGDTNPATVTNANMHLLYRSLGLLDVRGKTQGLGFGGRVPGRVNINTIWDPASSSQTLNAICDPPSASSTGNLFTSAMVTSAWTAINANRSMIMGSPSTVWTTAPTKLTDQPFQPPSAGYVNAGDLQFPNGQGVSNTILGLGNLSNLAQTHPYLRNELLTKIYNNVTTRSNTFAVYCTIGYFEVTNAGPFGPTNRPALGKEIGSDDGTNVRHKFFAIVDRTKLTTVPNLGGTPPNQQGASPVFLSYEPKIGANLTMPDPATNLGSKQQPVPIYVPATSGSVVSISGIYDGQSWVLSPGRLVNIDVGAKLETATVISVTYNGPGLGGTITLGQFSVGTTQHARGCIIQFDSQTPVPPSAPPAQLGNPGPQPQFNFKDPRYLPVVPFVARYN